MSEERLPKMAITQPKEMRSRNLLAWKITTWKT